jgi:hypothetical protein
MSSPQVEVKTSLAGTLSIRTSEYELTQEMVKLLSQFSKSAQRKAMTMVLALRGSRSVPIGIPIGNNSTRATVVDAGSESKSFPQKRKGPARKPKAEWRNNARWLQADAERSAIVSNLKVETNGRRKTALIASLRLQEEGMKALKAELRL